MKNINIRHSTASLSKCWQGGHHHRTLSLSQRCRWAHWRASSDSRARPQSNSARCWSSWESQNQSRNSIPPDSGLWKEPTEREGWNTIKKERIILDTFCSNRNFSIGSMDEKLISLDTARHLSIFFGTRASCSSSGILRSSLPYNETKLNKLLKY